MGRTITLALSLSLLVACSTSVENEPRHRVEFITDVELNENRAFGMTFNSKNELVVSGTAHNKRPAVAVWDGATSREMDVPEQVWLERMPTGEILGIGTTKLFSFGTNALSAPRELGEITPNPRTALNQSSARIGGDGSIYFVYDVGRFQRIPPGATTAVAIPVPAGTNPETALPGAYARTGDGRIFAGVRGAGIYEVTPNGAEMFVPCSDPEIDDCNGGDILVVDSYGRAPLFRRGTLGAKVYRLDLEQRRLVLVADLATLPDQVLTSVADAPNGDVYLATLPTEQATGGVANLLRAPAGSDPPRIDKVTEDVILGPVSIVVRSDGRIFLNAGFLLQVVF